MASENSTEAPNPLEDSPTASPVIPPVAPSPGVVAA
jgi:hypothetical protein